MALDGPWPIPGPPVADWAVRMILDHADSPYVILDEQGRVAWIGAGVAALLGPPSARYEGRRLVDLLTPDHRQSATAAFGDLDGNSGGDWTSTSFGSGSGLVIDVLDHDGTPVQCAVSVVGRDRRGVVLEIQAYRDPVLPDAVTDALAAASPLDDLLTRLARACGDALSNTEVLVGWDWTGDQFATMVATPALTEDSQLWTAITDTRCGPWATAINTNTASFPARLAVEDSDLADAAATAGFETCWTLPIAVAGNAAATAGLVLWRRHPGPGRDGMVPGAQRITRLISLALAADRYTTRLRHAASTDHLTGLTNRPAQHRRLTGLVTAPESSLQVTVLFCDLDDFKPVNDQHGHDVGDRVLAIVADRIAATLRPTDHVARWGGDEFVVTSTGSWPNVTVLADRLIERTRHPIAVDDITVYVGMSIGISSATPPVSADDLIEAADAALLDAKVAGKNQWKARPAKSHTKPLAEPTSR